MSVHISFHAIKAGLEPEYLRTRVAGHPAGTITHTDEPYVCVELGTRFHEHYEIGASMFLSLPNLRHLVTVLRDAEARLSVAHERFDMDWSETPTVEEVRA